MTIRDIFIERFTQMTGLDVSSDMETQIKSFSEQEIKTGLDRLSFIMVHKGKKLMNPFGYFCGIVFKLRNEQGSVMTDLPNKVETFYLSSDQFAENCRLLAEKLNPKTTLDDFKEPKFYTDQQVMILYLLFNARDFSTHSCRALKCGFFMPELPKYKAALTDFCEHRLGLPTSKLMVQAAFIAADEINKAEPRNDFNLKLIQLLQKFDQENQLASITPEEWVELTHKKAKSVL